MFNDTLFLLIKSLIYKFIEPSWSFARRCKQLAREKWRYIFKLKVSRCSATLETERRQLRYAWLQQLYHMNGTCRTRIPTLGSVSRLGTTNARSLQHLWAISYRRQATCINETTPSRGVYTRSRSHTRRSLVTQTMSYMYSRTRNRTRAALHYNETQCCSCAIYDLTLRGTRQYSLLCFNSIRASRQVPLNQNASTTQDSST